MEIKSEIQSKLQRSLPIFLNGKTEHCVNLLREVLNEDFIMVVDCQKKLILSEIYAEILEKFGLPVLSPETTIDMPDLIRALNGTKDNTYLILSNFQQLPQKAIRDFAIDLKIAFEESRLKFLIIGIFPEGNPLFLYNGDLWGRMTEILVQ